MGDPVGVTPLEVVGDFMRERAREILAAFPWQEAQNQDGSRQAAVGLNA
jgi:hypothetical protein